MKSLRSTQNGFSVIELMVASTASLFILGAGAALLFQSQVHHADRQLTTDVQQRIRTAFKGRSQELRMAGSGVPTNLETIERAEPNALVFLADIDAGNPAAPCTAETTAAPQPERIAYEVVNGNLQRQVSCRVGSQWVLESTGVLAQDIAITRDMTIFTYFNVADVQIGAGATLSKSDRDSVASIVMSVDLLPAGASIATRASATTQQISTRTVLRNAWAAAHTMAAGGTDGSTNNGGKTPPKAGQ
jgi:Tfp pilus assembly protein PilW